LQKKKKKKKKKKKTYCSKPSRSRSIAVSVLDEVLHSN
jgi:hypothetical protein